jgi:predicted metal-binding protein
MDDVELVGFDTCGGCDRNKATKIVARALKLKEKGAETIYLGNCLVNTCPFKDTFEKALKEEVKLPIIEKTHK